MCYLIPKAMVYSWYETRETRLALDGYYIAFVLISLMYSFMALDSWSSSAEPHRTSESTIITRFPFMVRWVWNLASECNEQSTDDMEWDMGRRIMLVTGENMELLDRRDWIRMVDGKGDHALIDSICFCFRNKMCVLLMMEPRSEGRVRPKSFNGLWRCVEVKARDSRVGTYEQLTIVNSPKHFGVWNHQSLLMADQAV